MKGFLGKYGILILAICLGIYAILAKLSIIHTLDFENIFLGMTGLWIVEMFKVEFELGEIKGKMGQVVSELGEIKGKKK